MINVNNHIIWAMSPSGGTLKLSYDLQRLLIDKMITNVCKIECKADHTFHVRSDEASNFVFSIKPVREDLNIKLRLIMDKVLSEMVLEGATFTSYGLKIKRNGVRLAI